MDKGLINDLHKIVMGKRLSFKVIPMIVTIILVCFVLYSLQDWADIDFGISEGVDFIAVSFVNDCSAVSDLKDYISTKSPK